LAQETTGQEELLRLLLDYDERHGDKGGWLLIALGMVYLGQMVQLIEKRVAAGPVVPAGKDVSAGPGGGLADLLGVLGPLMSSFKSTPPDPRSRVPSGPAASSTGQPPPQEPPPEEIRQVKNNEVIKWDPRLVGGARK